MQSFAEMVSGGRGTEVLVLQYSQPLGNVSVVTAGPAMLNEPVARTGLDRLASS